MHSSSQAYLLKVFEKVVLTRLGPISSSFNRSVLLKVTIRTYTCPRLIDLISNGVLPSLPYKSIRCSSRYAFADHSHLVWTQIYGLKLIFEFSNSVSHTSKNITCGKSTQLRCPITKYWTIIVTITPTRGTQLIFNFNKSVPTVAEIATMATMIGGPRRSLVDPIWTW